MAEFKDCRGKRIKLGDIIVYPVRRKSTMVLKEATVCEVPGKGCTVKEGVVAFTYPNGRRVVIQRPDRCAVVSDFTERNKKNGSV
ncbi:MAG: hypothetical protein ACYTFQ_03325 [Planctomycetota bacterium]|jgi:predicted RNA-binding Zn-ribbon protein involved in translation (DUF1610 family)